jgi:outer membrane protein assembly factor BamB
MMTPFTQRGYIMKIDEERFLINNRVYFTANGSEAPYRFTSSLSIYDPETKMGISGGPATKYGIGTLRAWDCSDPKGPPTLLWISTPGETFSGGGARCIGDGKIFSMHYYAHEASAWDLMTGEHLWTVPTRAITGIGCSYHDGKIFINSISNYILCLDANTGKELWWFQAGSGGYFVYQDPPVGYGKVYLSSRDGYLYCVDENTGALVWKHTPMIPFGNATHPQVVAHENEHVICDNKIYGIGASRPPSSAGSFAGTHGVSVFNCLNAHTGELIWECNNWCEAWKPNIADGKVYGSDYIYDRGVFEEDYKINTGKGSWIYCIGPGPTELSITTDKTDLKTGETVKISGQLIDVSPGAIGPVPEGYTEKEVAPAVQVPINVTYVGSDGVKKPIAYVRTDSEGKFSCEWAPWVTGGITISADSVGSDAYEAPTDALTTISVKSTSNMESILWPALIAAIVVAVALPIVIIITRKPK